MLNNQMNSKEFKTELSKRGNVEVALDNLLDRVHGLEKLTEEIIDLIQKPQPIPCASDGVSTDSDPTLSQRINGIDARVDDVNQRLRLAVEIISGNLGGIRLE